MSSLTKCNKVRIYGNHVKLGFGMTVKSRTFLHFDEPEAIEFQGIFVYIRIKVYAGVRDGNNSTCWNSGAIGESIIDNSASALHQNPNWMKALRLLHEAVDFVHLIESSFSPTPLAKSVLLSPP